VTDEVIKLHSGVRSQAPRMTLGTTLRHFAKRRPCAAPSQFAPAVEFASCSLPRSHRCVQPPRRIVPIEKTRDLMKVFGPLVLILEVIRVLEDIKHENRVEAPCSEFLMVLALQDHQLPRGGR
jgi:hypothetical protein